MKKVVALLLVICCLSSWTLAWDLEIVETGQTLYRGGTVPGLQAGTMGKLDLTRPDTLVFSSGTNSVEYRIDAIANGNLDCARAREQKSSTKWGGRWP